MLLTGCVHVVVLEGNGGAHWVVVVIHAIVASDGRVKSLPRDILLDYCERVDDDEDSNDSLVMLLHHMLD